MAEKENVELPIYRPNGRRLGVVFEDLTVTGVTAEENTVTDFARVLTNVITLPYQAVRLFAGSRKNTRNLIQGVSGVVRPGETLLVLGTPGAGCSTTLRAIASDIESFVNVDGQVDYSTISSAEARKMYSDEIVFNSEEDNHFANLTVANTLDYALKLRKPAQDKENTAEFIQNMRSKLLNAFGIPHTANTIVGNAFVRGVSGGERKRVSLAEVLTTNPAVACFDNPSRGLDSSSALAFCRLLKDMSRETGMTNIVSMYQTAESIYQGCFDRVLVLYQGRMIFSGKTGDARQYFINLGYLCEPRQTTPDFLTSVTSPTERTVRKDHVGPVPSTPDEFAQAFRSSSFYKQLQGEIADYRAEHASNPQYVNEFKAEVKRVKSSLTTKTAAQPQSLFAQTSVAIKRHYQLTWGDRRTLFTLLVLNVLNAVITGSCFYMAPKTATGSYERGGAIFFSLIYFFLNALAETPATVLSRSIIVKQRKLGLSHPAAYLIAQTVADMPIALFQALIFSACYYFMLGLGNTASQFWIFSLIVWVHYGAVSALFRMLGACAPNLNTALLMAGAAIPPCLTYSGFAPPWPTLHLWGSWMRRISPSPWALEALMGNEFNDITLSCTASQLVPNGPEYSNIRYQGCTLPGSVRGSADVPGATYLSLTYEMSRSHLWRNFGIIIAMWFIYTVIAAIGLTFTAREQGGASGHVFKRGAESTTLKESPSSSSFGDDVEKQPGRTIHDLTLEPVSSASSATRVGEEMTGWPTTKSEQSGSCFTFENVNYFVPVGGQDKQLLQNVTAYARPGQLTALMGASGAGKTTLLDTISQRKSEGRVEGNMLLNGKPLDRTFGRSCGFAMQQDVHEPFSTVREALQFSALLRQPAETPKAEKLEYCEYIINLLELGPIADALIGTPGEGGLGVEERKRVTIAVELAAKPPHLLFLDEPTSGLDSQAAYSIVYFLRKIAAEGVPIICTIHQPSGVLFEMFDHVLLLAPGGRTIYFGETGANSSKVAEYFGRYGAQMSAEHNPAEYIIETVAGGENSAQWHERWLQSPEKARVEQTIQAINEKQTSVVVTETTAKSTGQFALPLWPQIKIVSARHWTTVWRDGSYNFSRFFKILWCELFISFTFYMVKSDVQGLQNYVLSLLIIIQIIPAIAPDLQSMWFSKMAIYEARERNGIYSWSALTTALVSVEVPYQVVGFTLIYFIMYWTVGFPNQTHIAGYEYLQFLTLGIFAMTWNQLLATLFTNMQTCGLASALFWNILLIFSGTLVPHASLNTFYRYWLYWLTPFRWFFGGSISTLLEPVKVHCSATDLARFDPPTGQTCASYAAAFLSRAPGYLVNPDDTSDCGYCAYSQGSQYSATMDFHYSQRWRDWGVFLVFTVVSNVVLIYFVTWFTRVRGRKTS